MNDLLDALREFDALRDGSRGKDSLFDDVMDRQAPEYADQDIFDSLSPEIVSAIRENNIQRLYQHQADAIKAANTGHNVVLAAPTASGKTLSFAAPMYGKLRSERDTHALMIYPNKALANDQRSQFIRFFKNIKDPRGDQINSWWYDGDVTQDERSVLRRQPPHILITNPEMLHRSFLAHSNLWTKFLTGLKYVVVDEIHEYRGYFGSNVSLLLRRFNHYLAQQNIHPQYFMASATCANPKEHAEGLTGLTFKEVNTAGKFRPSRNFFFIKPEIPHRKYWYILQLRAINAGLASLSLGKSVLVFCPTRKFAEECAVRARHEVKKLRDEGRIDLSTERIEVFRGGLSTEKRHRIQNGLRSGNIRLVFTTNALELGIDIGGLDGIILAGFPDSIMSAWQRIGRAGRSWKSDAFVLYYALNNPMDQFYASNLHTFLQKPLDELVINSGNEELVDRHIPCLLYESSSFDNGESILGPVFYSAAKKYLEQGAKPINQGRYRPHVNVDLRGIGGGMYTLRRGSNDIGTMSAHQQFREAYLKAIYLHGGSHYRVDQVAISGGGGTIHLSPMPDHLTYLRTRPVLTTTVSIKEFFDGCGWQSGIKVFHGNATVTENLWSIEEYDDRTDAVQERWTPGTNNAIYSNAHAMWLNVDVKQLELASNNAAQGLRALQHLLRIGVFFTIPVEPHDIVTHVVVRDPSVYLIESYPAGIGIVRKAFDRWRQILDAGIRIAENCNCSKGCPNCIMPPRSSDELDKQTGIELAKQVLSMTNGPYTERLSNDMWMPV